MNRELIPDPLQLSAYHEGILYYIQRSSQSTEFQRQLSRVKIQNRLVDTIIHLNPDELRDLFHLSRLDFDDSETWNEFLVDLRLVSRQYKMNQGLLLGAVVELMNELNWQHDLDIRRLLVLFLHTEQELAHLRLASSGTNYSGLESWRTTIIEEASGKAKHKSKLA